MIKRYVHEASWGVSVLTEFEEGGVVKYDDHAAEVAKLRDALQELYEWARDAACSTELSNWLDEHPVYMAERVLKETK